MPQPAERVGQLALPHSQPMLAEVVNWYLDEWLIGRAEGTVISYRCDLRWWVGRLPGIPTEHQIGALHRDAVRTGELSAKTANKRLRTLRAAYSAAQRGKWPYALDPTGRVRLLPEPADNPRALPDPARQWPTLLNAAPDATARVFLGFMRRLGLAPGEARGVEWGHIDWQAGTVRILQQRSVARLEPGPLKTGITRTATLPIHPETMEALREASRDRMRASRLSRTWERYAVPYYRKENDALVRVVRERAPGILELLDGWHGLRHTFGTELVERGISAPKVQLLMRHASLQHTQSYIASIRGREVPVDDLRAMWALEDAEREATASLPSLPSFGSDVESGDVEASTAKLPRIGDLTGRKK